MADSEAAMGWHRVCLNTIVRKGEKLDSERLRILPMGSRVKIIQQKGRRVRIDSPIDGWCSLKSSTGDTILAKIEKDDSTVATPAFRQAQQQAARVDANKSDKGVGDLKKQLEATKKRLQDAEKEESGWLEKSSRQSNSESGNDLRIWDVVRVLNNKALGIGIVRWIGNIPDERFADHTLVAVEWGTPVGDSNGILNVNGEKFGFGPVPKGYASFEQIENCEYIPGEKWLKKLMKIQDKVTVELQGVVEGKNENYD